MSSLQNVLRDSTSAERSKAFFDYLFGITKEKGIPFSGTFELTPRCTLNCPMCYVHLQEEQMPKAELSTQQWIDLIEQAAEAGMMHARLTGGECFLHPGFQEILQALEDLGIFTKILTNATLLDEKMISWIARHPIEVIQISVYGSSPEMYRETTGNASAFHVVDRALSLLKEAGVRFEISITTSKQIFPYIEDIYRYCQSKDPMSIELSSNPFPARPETGRKAEDYRMNLEETVAYYRKYYYLTGEALPHCAITHEHGEEHGEDCQCGEHSVIIPTEGVLCAAGKALFCITWDGRMTPCGAIDWIQAKPLESGFQSAWSSIREAVSSYLYPTECVKCSHRLKCTVCPSIHPLNGASRATLNQAQCDETILLAREGLL